MDEATRELGRLLVQVGALLDEIGGRISPPTSPGLGVDHDLETVADALGMSTRWVRQRIAEGAAHQRYGNVIKFTDRQVAELRASHERREYPARQSITTGPRKRR